MMPPISPRSVCSDGTSASYYWVGCATGDHISATVEVLEAAVLGQVDRLKNPYIIAMMRAEFRDRLTLATRGRLVPSDHVKRIQSIPVIDLFEIRWDGIAMKERVGVSVRNISVCVRLYYVELADFGRVVLGVHAHEKQIVKGDASETRRL